MTVLRGHSGLHQYIYPDSEKPGDTGPRSGYGINDARVSGLIPLFELQTDDPVFDSPLSLTMSLDSDREVFWRMLGRARAIKRTRAAEEAE